MHRLVVTSATYRQASRGFGGVAGSRPGKPLCWLTVPRKRLTPYAIRDAALFTSGLLVEKIGGPSCEAVHAAGHLEKHLERQIQTRQGREALPPRTLHVLAPHGSSADNDGVLTRRLAKRCIVRSGPHDHTRCRR